GIGGSDAFGYDASFTEHSVYVGALLFHRQFRFEPAAKKRKIEQREHSSSEQAGFVRACEEADRATRGERRADQCEVKAGDGAEREFRNRAENSDDDEKPVDPRSQVNSFDAPPRRRQPL